MPTAPINNEPDLLASLSLSSNPLISSTNPIFGHPSLMSSASGTAASQGSPIKVDESADEDAMDWTPTNPSPVKVKNTVDDNGGAWLRPQRFFAPERPTGLESLFANTKLDDGDARSGKPSTVQRGLWNAKAIGWWIGAGTITIILIPLGIHHVWMKGWIQ